MSTTDDEALRSELNVLFDRINEMFDSVKKDMGDVRRSCDRIEDRLDSLERRHSYHTPSDLRLRPKRTHLINNGIRGFREK